ncbi:Uncharacterized protein FWK35_00034145, partial [Aphis craccivora]
TVGASAPKHPPPKSTTTVGYYQIGPNWRTEEMEAEIYRYHLNTGTSTNNATRIFARNMGNSNDHAGHILASRLGGSGTDLRNIFPQTSHMNMRVYGVLQKTMCITWFLTLDSLDLLLIYYTKTDQVQGRIALFIVFNQTHRVYTMASSPS